MSRSLCINVPYSKKHWRGKNFSKFGKLQHFAKFFVNFHNFHNIFYVNGLQFAKFFPPNSLQSLFAKLVYRQSFLLYGMCISTKYLSKEERMKYLLTLYQIIVPKCIMTADVISYPMLTRFIAAIPYGLTAILHEVD